MTLLSAYQRLWFGFDSALAWTESDLERFNPHTSSLRVTNQISFLSGCGTGAPQSLRTAEKQPPCWLQTYYRCSGRCVTDVQTLLALKDCAGGWIPNVGSAAAAGSRTGASVSMCVSGLLWIIWRSRWFARPRFYMCTATGHLTKKKSATLSLWFIGR